MWNMFKLLSALFENTSGRTPALPYDRLASPSVMPILDVC
jgi:hypothetical protein